MSGERAERRPQLAKPARIPSGDRPTVPSDEGPTLHRRAFNRAGLATAVAGGLAACGVAPVVAPVAPVAPPGAPVDGSGAPAQAAPAGTGAAAAQAEFRGAWVATVANIDWPSRPGLPAAQQRAEVVTLLDRAAAIGLNALVLQVRPAADAIYPSALEPWSEFLTGAQGRPPDEAYDPLAFWVAEAHRRGLALHAWFNPYRARHSMAKSAPAATHLSVTRPDLVKAYGDQLWIDPGEPDAAAHTLAVVADVLRRYDIDGVHIDDYFYPYPVKAAASVAGGVAGGVAGTVAGGAGDAAPDQPFPDEPAWQRYRQAGGALARDDWRRDNVNRLVQALQALVRRERPGLPFGISPFGLGRPDLRPPGIQGFSQFHKLYADVERWCTEGWCDYLAPQLYWPLDAPAQAFGVLLDYWLAQARPGLAVWPGLYTSRIGAAQRPYSADEVLRQVALIREVRDLREARDLREVRAARTMQADAAPRAAEPGGHIHFSLAALLQDRDGIATRLQAGPYRQPAPRPA